MTLMSCWITTRGTVLPCVAAWDHWNYASEEFPDAVDPEESALLAGWFKIGGCPGDYTCIGKGLNREQRRVFETMFEEPAEPYEEKAQKYFIYQTVTRKERLRKGRWQ